jgi:hypothetical protein
VRRRCFWWLYQDPVFLIHVNAALVAACPSQSAALKVRFQQHHRMEYNYVYYRCHWEGFLLAEMHSLYFLNGLWFMPFICSVDIWDNVQDAGLDRFTTFCLFLRAIFSVILWLSSQSILIFMFLVQGANMACELDVQAKFQCCLLIK